MSSLRIEHVNITVADPARTSDLMRALFDWRVRWSGAAQTGGHTIHVGSNDHYVALAWRRAIPDRDEWGALTKGRPLNHIGVEVDDIDATEARVIAAGLGPFSHADYDPGRRFYFLDRDGVEYEVVSYTSAAG